MPYLRRIASLFCLCASLFAQSQMHYLPTGNPFPVWQKISVANSGSNFAVTCVPATTNCGTASVAKAAALTQSVVLYALPANAFIDSCVVKSTTAFAGTTTLTATLGVTGALTSCVSTPFDLNAAVSNTNLSSIVLTAPVLSVAGTNLILALTGTVSNLSSISAGAASVWVKLSVLP